MTHGVVVPASCRAFGMICCCSRTQSRGQNSGDEAEGGSLLQPETSQVSGQGRRVINSQILCMQGRRSLTYLDRQVVATSGLRLTPVHMTDQIHSLPGAVGKANGRLMAAHARGWRPDAALCLNRLKARPDPRRAVSTSVGREKQPVDSVVMKRDRLEM